MLIQLLQEDPVVFAVLVPILLLSLTLHEFAHARIALAFGDPTALKAGRVSLNPLRHLDPIGTIMLLVAGFGWAKPVPVNPYHIRPLRLGNVMVSLAGPLSNLCLAVIAGSLLRTVVFLDVEGHLEQSVDLLYMVLTYTLVVNVCLFTFNLLPVFPLDGSHILGELLPPHMQGGFSRWQMKYGMIALILLVAGPGLFSRILHQPFPDPLGWLFAHAMNITERAVGLVS
ncbi:MAG: site-2 protease family protein [Phycisphaerae bacterium]|nr:site-2 protease family protein [Phycisphaerae bacterium]